MASRITFKKNSLPGTEPAAASLQPGEPAVRVDVGALAMWVGDAAGNPVRIGVRWRNLWQQQAYELHDMVRDGDWLMIANKATTDRAAPQPEGNPSGDLPDTPAFTTSAHTGFVRSGREWQVDDPVLVKGYQVWVPETGPEIYYEISLYAFPTGDPEQIKYAPAVVPVLNPGGWTTVSVPDALIRPGTTFGIVLNALNSASVTTFSGDWTRGSNVQGSANPGAGGWTRTTQENIINISHTDGNGGNRAAEISTIEAGATVKFTDSATPAVYSVYRVLADGVDGAGFTHLPQVELIEEGISGVVVGAETTMNATIQTPAATGYVRIAGGNPLPNSRGILSFDGTPQAGAENDAFGVRVIYDGYIASEDWDLMAVSGTSGASGGEPAITREFLDPTGTGSWRITGNFLEQWGTTPPGLAQGLIVMPKRFKDGTLPSLTQAVGASGSARFVASNAVNPAVTDPLKEFWVEVRGLDGNLATAQTSWRAVGIWDGVS